MIKLFRKVMSWLIPARTAAGDVNEQMTDGDGNRQPLVLPPGGPRHSYAPSRFTIRSRSRRSRIAAGSSSRFARVPTTAPARASVANWSGQTGNESGLVVLEQTAGHRATRCLVQPKASL